MHVSPCDWCKLSFSFCAHQIVGVCTEELQAAQQWNGQGILDLLRGVQMWVIPQPAMRHAKDMLVLNWWETALKKLQDWFNQLRNEIDALDILLYLCGIYGGEKL